jgi:Sulfotransferase family
MIISHEYKFIFIHIQKCAGTSITCAIAPHLAEGDIVLGGTPEGEKLSEEFRQTKGLHKHSKALEAKNVLGDEIWNSYFKFSLVRNPWDRLVSKYHWWLTTSWEDQWGTAQKIKSMKDFSEYLLSDLDFDKQQSVLDYLTDENGEIMVDFVGKFEKIYKDFAYICGRSGLPNLRLPHKNKSEHDNYLEYYKDPEIVELVNQWFGPEIKALNYNLHKGSKKRHTAGSK